MAYTNIDKPEDYFNTITWTGNASRPVSITGVGFQPDMVWAKSRSNAFNHVIYDSSRGAGQYKELTPNATFDEGGSNAHTYGYLTSFDSDGFSSTDSFDNHYFNNNGSTYVAWNWKVNGGTTTSLSSNINSVCQVNQDAGISIVKYTCTGGGNGQSVQHGLGLVPQVIITKNRTDTSYSDWITYHHILTKDNFVKLNSNAASATNSPYNQANPTSTTYNVSIDLVEQKDYVSYVFAPIQGYSKFGKYIGNGNANGPFVYTGFKPAFVMVKNASAVTNWYMWDNKRNPYNVVNNGLNTNTANATQGTAYDSLDFLSNGFKIRDYADGTWNGSGNTIIYMAFAENPFTTSTGVPCTAR